MRLSEQYRLFELVKELIPSACQTNGKNIKWHIYGSTPPFIKRGEGAYVWDIEDNRYLDFMCSLGAIILGYCHPVTNNAVLEQLNKGMIFSMSSPQEYELAKLICEVVPCAEMVKYGKNGSDVTLAAVRAARVFTNKLHIAKCGYHGWSDWHSVCVNDKGISPSLKNETHEFKYNDIDSLVKIMSSNEVAAIILEPAKYEEPKNNFLKKVKKISEEFNAVLIFDEIVSGFRFGLGGAQEFYNVKPDLATFSKAISNGMPLSVLTGKSEIMKKTDEIHYSPTFGGDCLSIAAAIATINYMKENKDLFIRIRNESDLAKFNLNKIFQKCKVDAKAQGLAGRFEITFSNECDKLRFKKELVEKRILISDRFYIQNSHSKENIRDMLDKIDEAFR